ncbi:DUF2946 family protein [Rhodovibrionaceae bacterium A322]
MRHHEAPHPAVLGDLSGLVNRRKHKRLFGLLPAVVWLLTQLMMTGVLLSAPSQAAASADPGSPFSDSIVICTPNGLKYVTLGPDGTPVEVQDKDLGYCPWCRSFAAPVALAPAFLDWAYSPLQRGPLRWSLSETAPLLDLARAGPFHSRAPPL